MTLPLAWKKSSAAINLWEKIARSSDQRDPENNSTSNLWNNLQTTIDLVHWKPAPAAGILARELRERNGTYYVLKNPRARTYLRLLPREYWLWQKLDGKQSVQDLVVAYFLEYGTFAFGLVAGLVQQLRAKEMLSEQPQSVFGSVQLALNDQRARGKLTRPLRALLSAEWAIARLDRLIGALYRWIGGLIYSRPAQIIFFATSVIGLGAYLRIVSDDNYRFLATTDLRINIAVLWLLTIVPVIIHELGHALTTKHFGREVYRGGLMLYLGIPAAFVDTTDIWMEPKRARLAVTWAGPYSGFILAGSCAIIIWFAPALNIAPILFQLATIGLALSILNLNPALNLDGYHLLSDAVEIPRLQERAFAFLRHNFISKFFRRERLTRDEIIYVLFGALLGLWTLYVLFVTVVVWRARAVESIAVALAALDRNAILLIRAVILLLVLAFLILARARIGSFITRVTDLIRRYRIFSGRRRAALGIALGALILASASELLAPEAAELFEFVLGVGAILASAYLAFLVARELRGGIYARAFGVFATALAAMSVANILWWLPMTLTDAFAIAFDFIALVLIGIAYAMLARLFGGLGSSWRAISIWFLVAGWLIFFLAFFISTFAQVTLHLLAGLLFLGGMLHWHAANLQPLAVEQISLADQSARAALFAAFTGLVENILRQTNAAYGRHVRARVESEFDRRALAKGWEIRFGNRSEDLFSAASSYRRLPASDLGEIFAASLDALLKALARLAGDFFARRVLARAYDALDWDLREIASEYIFPHVASASALSQEFQQHRGDLIALLQRAPLFTEFNATEIKTVAARLRAESFARNQTIIRQGDAGDKFYFVRRGRVQISQRDATGLEQPLEELVAGDYFGERALLTGEPRNASVRALAPVEALTLTKKDFDRLIRPGFEGHRKVDVALRRVNMLHRIPIFADFDAFELGHLATQLQRIRLGADQIVFAQGDSGDRFFIVETGQVAVRVQLPSGEIIENARMGPGEYFGEIALLMDVPRTATIVTSQPTQLLSIQAEDFKQLIWHSKGVNRALERTASRRYHFYSQTIGRTANNV